MGQVAYAIRGDIGALFLGLMFVLGLVPARATQQGSTTRNETIVEPYKDADAYAIYAILLQGNKCCSLVIQSETLSWPSAIRTTWE